MSGNSDWPESRIERALVWLLRTILFLLAIWALVRGEYANAAIVAVMLALHGAAYLVAPRVEPATLRRWLLTLVDIIFGSLAFYLTGNVAGQGSVLGFMSR